MERQPPDFVLRLQRVIENGTDEEATKARDTLRQLQSRAGKKGQAVRRAKLAEQSESLRLKQEMELEEYIQTLLDGNAHLMPLGELPPDIEELLKPHRLD